jgi:hypothetical protein
VNDSRRQGRSLSAATVAAWLTIAGAPLTIVGLVKLVPPLKAWVSQGSTPPQPKSEEPVVPPDEPEEKRSDGIGKAPEQELENSRAPANASPDQHRLERIVVERNQGEQRTLLGGRLTLGLDYYQLGTQSRPTLHVTEAGKATRHHPLFADRGPFRLRTDNRSWLLTVLQVDRNRQRVSLEVVEIQED